MNLIEFRLWLQAWMGKGAGWCEAIGLGNMDAFRLDDAPWALEPASLNATRMRSSFPSPPEMAAECTRWYERAIDPEHAWHLENLARRFSGMELISRPLYRSNTYELYLNVTTGEMEMDWTLSPRLPSTYESLEEWLVRVREDPIHVAAYRPWGIPLYAVPKILMEQYFMQWIEDLLYHGGMELRLSNAGVMGSSRVFEAIEPHEFCLDIALVLNIVTGRRPRIILKEPLEGKKRGFYLARLSLE